MANNLFRRILGLPLPSVKPYQEMGVAGTTIYAGYVQNIERSSDWIGQNKWKTASEIVTNISIVAAGTRHFLDLIAHPTWSIEPADDSDEAKKFAELFETAIYDMVTPWPRVIRRAGMYRFHGFGIQEWTAKKRKDGQVGFLDIEARPQHTIERWEVDDSGAVIGVFQRSPMTGVLLGLPRSKIVYLVDDTLTDSPEGLGVFRHLGEPYNRLKQYLLLETSGFERDLRGTPVGRAPLTLINDALKAGTITADRANELIQGIKDFVKLQVKEPTTGIVLDSMPYESQAADGTKIATALHWGLELLTGSANGLAELGHAIDRLQREMARILGTEHLMMGDQGGNRALSLDKSRNLYIIANSVLDNIGSCFEKDIGIPLADLNGVDHALIPNLKHEDVTFKSIEEVTGALKDMAVAGAVLAPDDPAINDVRDLLGISHAPEIDMEQYMLLRGQQPSEPEDTPETGDDEEGAMTDRERKE